MFTRCPECQHQATVSVEQLRDTRGMLVCERCHARFDALASLSQQQPITPKRRVQAPSPARPAAAARQPGANATWWGWLLAGLLLLAGQGFAFNYHALSQTPSTRPVLLTLCQWLNCPVPDYRNLDDFAVLSSQFNQLSTLHYRFLAVLHHQGAFPQLPPHLRLNLTDVTGKILASRVFSAAEYMDDDTLNRIAPAQTIKAQLDLGIRDSQVAGYTFSLQ
ncbi:MAG: zinc-ribbon and DUF3426 domain-containing protein [Methylococcales bacterium]|nr:zinc-ribbon and DUF3426 domain-containing protein [Methylococcales bacterium]